MTDFTLYTHLKIQNSYGETGGLVVLRRTARTGDDELAYMICPRLIVRRRYVYFFPRTDCSVIVQSTYYHCHYYSCCDVPIVTHLYTRIGVRAVFSRGIQVGYSYMWPRRFARTSFPLVHICIRNTGIHKNNIMLPIYHVRRPSSNRVSVS